MSLDPGTYRFGPANGELRVRTGRQGAAAKAGHDLTIEVGEWSGTLTLDAEPSRSTVELTADGGSLVVLEGTGGITSLGADDKENIRTTIDDEILKRTTIAFRSTSAERGAGDGHLKVQGELELLGRRMPLSFELTSSDAGTVTGSAVVRQSSWGIKPYSTLFGTLKVSDEVEVTFAGRPAGSMVDSTTPRAG